MAPRETYDPEDIESLLSERSFDELLSEERAFVLRHLNGREEYERMRELLLRVREDESAASREILEPDAAVRDRVLEVFRQERNPSWRIWLNSVQAFLFPQQASAMWRPALALATVAVLVAVGVVTVHRMTGSTAPEMAEVRKPEALTAPPTPLENEDKDGSAPVLDDAVPAEHASSAASRRSGDLTQPTDLWSPLADVAEAPPPAQEEALSAEMADEVISEREVMEVTADAQTQAAAAPPVNYVEKDQLLANQSMANASGAVTMKEVAAVGSVSRHRRKGEARDKAAADALESRSLAQDDQLLQLLNAAW